MATPKPVLATVGDIIDQLPPVYPERAPQPAIFAAMVAITKALGDEGIAKSEPLAGSGVKFQFRGIDQIYEALNRLLVEHDVIVTPRVVNSVFLERGTTSKGSSVFGAQLQIEFTFTSARDGSFMTAQAMGEGMDSSDKATNKASSGAYKYVMLQVFCIPIKGLAEDGDRSSPEVEVPLSKGEEGRALYERLSKANRALRTTPEFNAFWTKKSVDEAFRLLPASWRKNMVEERSDKAAEISELERLAADDTFPGDRPDNSNGDQHQ